MAALYPIGDDALIDATSDAPFGTPESNPLRAAAQLSARVRTTQSVECLEEDGSVTIITGTLDYGQGHAPPFAQVLSDRPGIPFDRIKLLQGDSDELLAGGGTGGPRSMIQSGGAIVSASEQVVERGKQAAAHFLEAAVADVEFVSGAKGCGEAGCAGYLPSVMNALADALSAFSITHIDMPATPPRIWQAIHEARASAAAGPACHDLLARHLMQRRIWLRSVE